MSTTQDDLNLNNATSQPNGATHSSSPASSLAKANEMPKTFVSEKAQKLRQKQRELTARREAATSDLPATQQSDIVDAENARREAHNANTLAHIWKQKCDAWKQKYDHVIKRAQEREGKKDTELESLRQKLKDTYAEMNAQIEKGQQIFRDLEKSKQQENDSTAVFCSFDTLLNPNKDEANAQSSAAGLLGPKMDKNAQSSVAGQFGSNEDENAKASAISREGFAKKILADLKAKLEVHNATNDELTKTKSLLQTKTEDFQKEIEQLTRQNTQLTEEKARTESEYAEFQNATRLRNEASKQQIASLSTENKELEEVIDDYYKDQSVMVEAMEKMKIEINALRQAKAIANKPTSILDISVSDEELEQYGDLTGIFANLDRADFLQTPSKTPNKSDLPGSANSFSSPLASKYAASGKPASSSSIEVKNDDLTGDSANAMNAFPALSLFSSPNAQEKAPSTETKRETPATAVVEQETADEGDDNDNQEKSSGNQLSASTALSASNDVKVGQELKQTAESSTEPTDPAEPLNASEELEVGEGDQSTKEPETTAQAENQAEDAENEGENAEEAPAEPEGSNSTAKPENSSAAARGDQKVAADEPPSTSSDAEDAGNSLSSSAGSTREPSDPVSATRSSRASSNASNEGLPAFRDSRRDSPSLSQLASQSERKVNKPGSSSVTTLSDRTRRNSPVITLNTDNQPRYMQGTKSSAAASSKPQSSASSPAAPKQQGGLPPKSQQAKPKAADSNGGSGHNAGASRASSERTLLSKPKNGGAAPKHGGGSGGRRRRVGKR